MAQPPSPDTRIATTPASRPIRERPDPSHDSRGAPFGKSPATHATAFSRISGRQRFVHAWIRALGSIGTPARDGCGAG
jgi:hypothetical protein